jgi:diguanylate cyclase (GGDEF)-like protein
MLVAALQKLRRYAAGRGEGLGEEGRRLLAEALDAAAEAERSLTLQKARIRLLEGLTVTDELTGLLNRRGFDLELQRTLARAQRLGEEGLLVLCDLDRFKAVNDRHGHPAGDRLLQGMAAALRARTRRSDAVARVGGDEFAILLTHTTPERARARWREMEHGLQGRTIRWQTAEIPIRASFGSAPYGPRSDAANLFNQADRALYRAKKPHRLVYDRGGSSIKG